MNKRKLSILLAGTVISVSVTADSISTEKIKIAVLYDDSALCKAFKKTPRSSITTIESKLKARLQAWVSSADTMFNNSQAKASIHTTPDAIQYRYVTTKNKSGNLPPRYFKDRNSSLRSSWINWCEETDSGKYHSITKENVSKNIANKANGTKLLENLKTDEDAERIRIETRSDLVSQISGFIYYDEDSQKGMGGLAYTPTEKNSFLSSIYSDRENTKGYSHHKYAFSTVMLSASDANLNNFDKESGDIFSFTHEIGHNFGLKHSEKQENKNNHPMIDFAWGYGKERYFSTIMTYPRAFNVMTRSPYFSNPNIRNCRIGRVTTTCGSSRANSVNGINKTAFILSRYKSERVIGGNIDDGLFGIRSKSGLYLNYPTDAPYHEDEYVASSKTYLPKDTIGTKYIQDKDRYILRLVAGMDGKIVTDRCLSEENTTQPKWVSCNYSDNKQLWEFIEDNESYYYIKSNSGNFLKVNENRYSTLEGIRNSGDMKFAPIPNNRENKLVVDDKLNTNQRIYSPNREYFLAMQGDGNLVIYNKQYTPVWYTATGGSNKTFAVLQSDGNFVVHDPNSGRTLWSTRTGGSRVYAELENSGRFKIKTESGSVLWQSH